MKKAIDVKILCFIGRKSMISISPRLRNLGATLWNSYGSSMSLVTSTRL